MCLPTIIIKKEWLLKPLSYNRLQRFGLVWFGSMTTIASHFMPKPFYTYIKFMISNYILNMKFLNVPELVYFLGGSGMLHTV